MSLVDFCPQERCASSSTTAESHGSRGWSYSWCSCKGRYQLTCRGWCQILKRLVSVWYVNQTMRLYFKRKKRLLPRKLYYWPLFDFRSLLLKVNKMHLVHWRKLLTSFQSHPLLFSCDTCRHWHPSQLRRIPLLFSHSPLTFWADFCQMKRND